MKFDLSFAGYCTVLEKFMLPISGRYEIISVPSIFGVLQHPSEGVILIDTGYERKEYDEATMQGFGWLYRWLIPVYVEPKDSASRQLESMGINADDVRFVVITHFHADHVCGLKSFPKAKYIVAKEGWNHLNHMSKFGASMHAFFKDLLPDDFTDRLITVPFDSSCFIKGMKNSEYINIESDFGPLTYGWDLFGDKSLILVELPGHCHGHMGAIIQVPNKNPVFMVGDACWSIKNVMYREMPHFLSYLIVHCNGKEYDQSIMNIAQVAESNKEVLVVPSHCFQALSEWKLKNKK